MRTKHGILTSEFVDTAEQIANEALKHGYTHIWAMKQRDIVVPAKHDEYSFSVAERHKKPATVTVYKRGSGKVNLILLQNTAWGEQAFKGIYPDELLTAVGTIESRLGVPMSGSPGSMGWAYLKVLHPEWIEDVHSNLKELHFTPKAGGDLIWQHSSLKQGQGLPHPARYVHKWDRRGAYPYASTQTDYGVGTPQFLYPDDAHKAAQHEKGHAQEVGVWNCVITYNPLEYDSNMPPIWHEHDNHGQKEEWLSGPIIRLLRACGHRVDVYEGYVFPQRHKLLSLWANNLYNFRTDCPYSRARDAFKQIANTTIGFTAFKGFDEDELEMRRPDIRLQTVARQRELLTHNIRKIKKLTGEAPGMVYMDAVYYFSDFKQLSFWDFKQRENEFGGMRYEGAIEITPEVQAMFERKMSVADRLEVLNKIGWVK